MSRMDMFDWGKELHTPVGWGELVDQVFNDPQSTRKEGLAYKVMILSAPDSPDTIKLDALVLNDLVSKSGRTTAFTQNQRYVPLAKLRLVKRTSDLVD